MDLIAILTTDGNVLIYRVFAFQRMFLIKASSTAITSLTWSPDGLLLAVGHFDGSIVLYNIETGEIDEHQVPVSIPNVRHHSEIILLQWLVQQHPSLSSSNHPEFQNRGRRYLLNNLSSSASMDSSSMLHYSTSSASSTSASVAKSQQFELLVSVDLTGKLLFHAFGQLPIWQCQLFSPGATLDGRTRRIHSICLSSDFSSSFAITTNDTMNCPVLQRLSLPFGNSPEHSQSNNYTIMAQELIQVHQLILHSQQLCQKIQSLWKQAVKIFQIKMSLLPDLFERYQDGDEAKEDTLSHNMAQMAMFDALISGIVAPPLQQFFAQNLNEQVMKTR